MTDLHLTDPDPLDPATPPLEPADGEELARDEVTVDEMYRQATGDHAAQPDWRWPTWTLHGR